MSQEVEICIRGAVSVDAGRALKQIWNTVSYLLGWTSRILVGPIQANPEHLFNAVAMLGQHRRRWTNLATAFGENLGFAGVFTFATTENVQMLNAS